MSANLARQAVEVPAPNERREAGPLRTYRVNLRRTTVHFATVTVRAEDDIEAEGIAGDMGLDGQISWERDGRGPGFDIDVIDVEEIGK